MLIHNIALQNNSDFFTKFKKSYNSDVPTANSKNEVLVENVIKDSRKKDVESPKKKVLEDLPSEEKNVKKSRKKKDSENKNKKKNSQKVKRKRIQTFDDSSDEVDSEEEGICICTILIAWYNIKLCINN